MQSKAKQSKAKQTKAKQAQHSTANRSKGEQAIPTYTANMYIYIYMTLYIYIYTCTERGRVKERNRKRQDQRHTHTERETGRTCIHAYVHLSWSCVHTYTCIQIHKEIARETWSVTYIDVFEYVYIYIYRKTEGERDTHTLSCVHKHVPYIYCPNKDGMSR